MAEKTRRMMLGFCAVWFLLVPPAPAQADTITSANTVHLTFNLDGYSSWGAFPLGTLDYFEFAIYLAPVAPVTSFTTRLYDGDQLLGTYTSPFTTFAVSRFISPTSQYIGSATVVDFTAFNDASIDGRIEFTIQGGAATLNRTSDELSIGRATEPTVGFTSAIYPTAFEITGGDQPPVVPEPATMLLTASGLALAALGRRRRARP